MVSKARQGIVIHCFGSEKEDETASTCARRGMPAHVCTDRVDGHATAGRASKTCRGDAVGDSQTLVIPSHAEATTLSHLLLSKGGDYVQGISYHSSQSMPLQDKRTFRVPRVNGSTFPLFSLLHVAQTTLLPSK